MKIENRTRGTMIAAEAQVADSFLSRGRGLIGRPPLREGQALVIRPCKGIHTWFMKYPIDVVYVDATDTVIDIETQIAPWRLCKPRRKASYVIELRAGTATPDRVQIGDQIALVRE